MNGSSSPAAVGLKASESPAEIETGKGYADAGFDVGLKASESPAEIETRSRTGFLFTGWYASEGQRISCGD